PCHKSGRRFETIGKRGNAWARRIDAAEALSSVRDPGMCADPVHARRLRDAGSVERAGSRRSWRWRRGRNGRRWAEAGINDGFGCRRSKHYIKRSDVVCDCGRTGRIAADKNILGWLINADAPDCAVAEILAILNALGREDHNAVGGGCVITKYAGTVLH